MAGNIGMVELTLVDKTDVEATGGAITGATSGAALVEEATGVLAAAGSASEVAGLEAATGSGGLVDDCDMTRANAALPGCCRRAWTSACLRRASADAAGNQMVNRTARYLWRSGKEHSPLLSWEPLQKPQRMASMGLIRAQKGQMRLLGLG